MIQRRVARCALGSQELADIRHQRPRCTTDAELCDFAGIARACGTDRSTAIGFLLADQSVFDVGQHGRRVEALHHLPCGYLLLLLRIALYAQVGPILAKGRVHDEAEIDRDFDAVALQVRFDLPIKLNPRHIDEHRLGRFNVVEEAVGVAGDGGGWKHLLQASMGELAGDFGAAD